MLFWFVGEEEVAVELVVADFGLEIEFVEEAEPVGAGEETAGVSFVFDADGLVVFAEGIDVFDGVGRVGGVGVIGPFEITEGAVVAVAAAVIGGGLEGFAGVVGDEEKESAGFAMKMCGL